MAKSNQEYIIIEQDEDYSDNNLQYDDIMDDSFKERESILNFWKMSDQFEQKSYEWLKQRSQYIGGSEAGCLIGQNPYEPYYKLIIKKLITIPFLDFSNVYIGNKYEDIAVMLYEYLKNVKIDSYGFLTHKTIPFIGASPDGITGSYKYDGIHKSNKNGRLVEIKCAVSRKINMKTNAKIDEIVPKYYYPQIQQQMETCDLNETDFWQLKVVEYDNYLEYEEDTSNTFLYKSKDNKFKGAIIQILPTNKFIGINLNDVDVKQKIYANAKFIMPPSITLSPKETKQWIIDVRNKNIPDNINLNNNYVIKQGYSFHKAFYWKVDHGRCTKVERNKKWFQQYFHIYQKTWDYITFLRANDKQKYIFLNIYNLIENGEVKINKCHINDYLITVLNILMNNDINSNEVKELMENYKINNINSEDIIMGIQINNN